VEADRELTAEERRLVRWMLEHGEPEARDFLAQLERARVTPWRCECGCASINFSIGGQPKPSGGLHPIAHFVFGREGEESGIFAYEQSGVLAGVEVYGMAGDAPKLLPTPDMLRSFSDATPTI
jgi:hypothetical protein